MPGKKKASTANLGSLVIKDRFKGSKSKKKNENSWMHTSELQDGYDWGRLNLQSVTQQSNLDDFLATAELAGTEFAAEKLNIQVIDPNAYTGLPSKDELAEIKEKHAKNQNLLTIPRRPQWDANTTASELELMERESFLKWRKQNAVIQEEMQILMTPFERNLEVWRQLWRVIERSDIVVQIVDARNPLMFRCPDLEKYVTEVNPEKQNIILVNKADLLSEDQRRKWKEYFTREGIQVAFWSAKAETERINQLSPQTEGSEEHVEREDEVYEENEEEENSAIITLDNRFNGINIQESEEVDVEQIHQSESNQTTLSESQTTNDQSQYVLPTGATNHTDSLNSNIPKDSNSSNPKEFSNLNCDENSKYVKQNENTGSKTDKCEQGDVSMKHNVEIKDEVETEDVCLDCHVLNGDQLLELLKASHKGNKVTDGQLTIGLVGYPNVGKSSTINALLQCKKVQVSSTPGRTKHFQTLYLDPTLMLCDCPGLVMPSFVTTKAEMIINGVLPIDQMRDFKPAVTLVTQVIPRPVFEATYGITIIKPKEGEDPERPPTAMELVNAYAYIRGFMNTKGMPDSHRASRLILKDFVNGRLLYCHPPPGIHAEEFQVCQSQNGEVEGSNIRKHKEIIVVSEDGIKHKHHPMNSVDTAFFKQQSLSGHSKGVHGVKDFARVSNYTTHTATAAEEGAVNKPWKKHGNRNKKTKLRKTYGHLDTK